MSARGASALVGLAVTLVSCGGGVGNTAQVQASASAVKAQAVYAKCNRDMSALLAALSDLDSRLGVGLTQSDYNGKVGDVKVAYDKINVSSLDKACVNDVGVHLENALNSYIEADKKWGNCITNTYCSTDSITPDLQAKWADATSEIQAARDGLANLKPSPTPVGS